MPFIDYRNGTVSVDQPNTDGKYTVTGNRTYWLGRIRPGDWFQFNTPSFTQWCEVFSVESNERLILRLKPGDQVIPPMTNVGYVIRRNPDKAITAELAYAQLKILDEQAKFNLSIDVLNEHVAEAGIQAAIAQNAADVAVAHKNTFDQTLADTITNRQQSEAARDASISAKNLSEAARDDTLAYKNTALSANETAVAAKNVILTARDTTLTARDVTLAARDNTLASQSAVTTMRSEVFTARDITTTARDTTLNYMNAAISASNTAVAARDTALVHRTAAEAAATTATEQAVISTTQAGISTTQAATATGAANTLTANTNQAGGIVVLDSQGKIPFDLIPGQVKSVKSYPKLSDFPATGDPGYIYHAVNTNKAYLWADNTSVYVPVDTTLALAGNGSAGTAARSDHDHNTAYEPLRNLAWAEWISADVINTRLREGVYSLRIDTVANISDREYPCAITVTIRKKVNHDNAVNTDEFIDTAVGYLYENTTETLFTRKLQFLGDTLTSSTPWTLLTAGDSMLWNGHKISVVPALTDSMLADTNSGTVYFAAGTAPDTINYAVTTINGERPDGTGNINIQGFTTQYLSVVTGAESYANANTFTKNQACHINVETGVTTMNYPTNANTFFARIHVTYDSLKRPFSIFQEWTSIFQDGTIQRHFRYGTNSTFSAWIQL